MQSVINIVLVMFGMPGEWGKLVAGIAAVCRWVKTCGRTSTAEGNGGAGGVQVW